MSLELAGLTKKFGDVTAAADVHLTVAEGETLALLGPSGCGKSTLLRLVAGLERPDAGRVFLGGRDLTPLAPQERGVGMVFQSFALFPHLNVAKNVEFGLVEARQPRPVREARVKEMLQLTGLGELGHRRVHELSGGQQQRVSLARALAPDPATLLLDEPLSNLDELLKVHLRAELARLFRSLSKRAIYVTHDQTEAFALANRVALMRAGRIVQVGAPGELLEEPISRWAAEFLGHENVYEPATSGRLPLTVSGEGVLFRADRATLSATLSKSGASAAAGSTPVVITETSREGPLWRLTLNAPEWGVVVKWRGFDRELGGAVPTPGARLTLHAPPTAWRLLPGEGRTLGDDGTHVEAH